jgi:hypothetical protein
MYPPAIIIVNGNIDGYDYAYGDLDEIGKQTLISQLFINSDITEDEFNNRIIADPNYPTLVHNFNYRILVISPDINSCGTIQYADVVAFVKYGMLHVQKNNCGPPGLTLPLNHLDIHQLLRYNNSEYVLILPDSVQENTSELGGIVVLQGADSSGVYDANEDNETHNTDFINR